MSLDINFFACSKQECVTCKYFIFFTPKWHLLLHKMSCDFQKMHRKSFPNFSTLVTLCASSIWHRLGYNSAANTQMTVVIGLKRSSSHERFLPERPYHAGVWRKSCECCCPSVVHWFHFTFYLAVLNQEMCFFTITWRGERQRRHCCVRSMPTYVTYVSVWRLKG